MKPDKSKPTFKERLKSIPAMYQVVLAVVAATVFVLTYHDQFVTTVQAAEIQSQNQSQIKLLRIDGYETEKRALVRAKAKAVSGGKTAEAEILEQDIQTLRDKIKSLCDKLDDC